MALAGIGVHWRNVSGQRRYFGTHAAHTDRNSCGDRHGAGWWTVLHLPPGVEEGSVRMSLFPENSHSMIDKATGLGVVGSRRAYQVRSLRFQYHPLTRGDANWVLDGLTFDVDA